MSAQVGAAEEDIGPTDANGKVAPTYGIIGRGEKPIEESQAPAKAAGPLAVYSQDQDTGALGPPNRLSQLPKDVKDIDGRRIDEGIASSERSLAPEGRPNEKFSHATPWMGLPGGPARIAFSWGARQGQRRHTKAAASYGLL